MAKTNPKKIQTPKKAPKLALPKGAIVVWEDPTARGGIKSKPVVTAVGTKLVKKLSAAGWPLYGIAGILGLKKDVFTDVRKRQPEIQQAVDDGRASLQAELVHHLLEGARAGQFVPAIFLLKSLCGVREAGPSESGHGATINISIPAGMSKSEFQDIIDITPTKDEPEPEPSKQMKSITR